MADTQTQSTGNVFDQYEAGLKQPSSSTSAQSAQSTQPAAAPSTPSGNVFDAYEAGVKQQSQQPMKAPSPGQINTDDPNDGFFTRQAKKAAAVGAGVGEDVLDAASLGAKALHLPHQTIDERSQELADDNADNPGLRTTGRVAGVVVPALATGVPQAAVRVGAAGLEGVSDGVLEELAKHGLDAKSLLGAAVKKGGRTFVVNQLGSSLGLSPAAVKVLDLISAAL